MVVADHDDVAGIGVPVLQNARDVFERNGLVRPEHVDLRLVSPFSEGADRFCGLDGVEIVAAQAHELGRKRVGGLDVSGACDEAVRRVVRVDEVAEQLLALIDELLNRALSRHDARKVARPLAYREEAGIDRRHDGPQKLRLADRRFAADDDELAQKVCGEGWRVERERLVLLEGDKADGMGVLREKVLGIDGFDDVEGYAIVVRGLLICWKKSAAPGHGATWVLGRRDDLEIAEMVENDVDGSSPERVPRERTPSANFHMPPLLPPIGSSHYREIPSKMRGAASAKFRREPESFPILSRREVGRVTRFLAGPPEICAHLGIGAQTTGRSGRNLSGRPACLRYGGAVASTRLPGLRFRPAPPRSHSYG